MADFTLSVSTASGIGYAGQKFPISVTVSGVDFTGAISFSLANAPLGSAVTYFPGNPFYQKLMGICTATSNAEKDRSN